MSLSHYTVHFLQRKPLIGRTFKRLNFLRYTFFSKKPGKYLNYFSIIFRCQFCVFCMSQCFVSFFVAQVGCWLVEVFLLLFFCSQKGKRRRVRLTFFGHKKAKMTKEIYLLGIGE